MPREIIDGWTRYADHRTIEYIRKLEDALQMIAFGGIGSRGDAVELAYTALGYETHADYLQEALRRETEV